MTPKFPEIIEVTRIALKPGDVVLVKCKEPVEDEHADRIRELCKQAFPDNQVVVVDDTLELSVVESA
jgi:hypothetical protein